MHKASTGSDNPNHAMNLIALPAFTDNYVWMLHDGRDAVVVDPGEAAPVIAALDAQALRLAGILITHHHGDHIGGVNALRPRLPAPDRVWGPARESMPQPCHPLQEGDVVEVLGQRFEVLDVPGHTAGHIAFYCAALDGGGPLLFCGDTLFSAGCGRLFEGTPAQMHTSLSKLAALPGTTRVCCTHEYTLGNLRFALAAEPDNAAALAYRAWCEAERASGRPTLPSTVAREREVNPFLRCDQPALVAAAQRQGATARDEVSTLAALREWKNRFQ
jgi:hydroxyacylglutathione hydrolase